MKYWAQFYRMVDGAWAEGVGDRQMIFLDGRWGLSRMDDEARNACLSRGYEGYQIARGFHISKPFYLTASVKRVR